MFVVPDERARDDERHEDLVAAVLGEYDRTLRIAVERDDARALLRYDPQETMARKYPGFHVRCAPPRATPVFRTHVRPRANPLRWSSSVVVVEVRRRVGTRRTSVDDRISRRPSHLRRPSPLSPASPPDDRVGGRVDMDVTEATRRGRFPFARGDLDRHPTRADERRRDCDSGTVLVDVRSRVPRRPVPDVASRRGPARLARWDASCRSRATTIKIGTRTETRVATRTTPRTRHRVSRATASRLRGGRRPLEIVRASHRGRVRAGPGEGRVTVHAGASVRRSGRRRVAARAVRPPGDGRGHGLSVLAQGV